MVQGKLGVFNRTYQTCARQGGELQSLQEVISAALEAVGEDARFYRPRRRVKPAARQCTKINDQQFEPNFNPNPPDKPLIDLFPEAYD